MGVGDIRMDDIERFIRDCFQIYSTFSHFNGPHHVQVRVELGRSELPGVAFVIIMRSFAVHLFRNCS